MSWSRCHPGWTPPRQSASSERSRQGTNGACKGYQQAALYPSTRGGGGAARRVEGFGFARVSCDRDVDLAGGFIEVSAATSKTRSRRLVPILDAQRAWLTPVACAAGPVIDRNLRKRHEKARQRAGVNDWPDNAKRHSFVSYRLAATGNAAQTALESGHDQAVLFAHYRELVGPKEADRFWSIRPEANEEQIVSFFVNQV